MARSDRIPEMRLHKSSGHAYVLLNGKQHYLGVFGSPEARAKYDRVVTEWLARGRRPVESCSADSDAALFAAFEAWLARSRSAKNRQADPAVSKVLAAFMAHAVEYYRSATGEQSGEAGNFVDALKPVRKLYGDAIAKDFTTTELEAVRADMIRSGLARKTINSRINRVRRVWKWAASKKMVPASTYAGLMTLAPLLKNRSSAREAKGVAAVALDRIKAVLPHLPGPVAAMVEIQTLTGCRVGEVLSMRGVDVHQDCDPWEFRPSRHKNDFREDAMARVIPLGPRARAIVAEHLARCRDPQAHLFNPRDAIVEKRKNGKRVGSTKRVKRYYDRRAYTQAIYRGCDRAFPHPVISQIKTSRARKLTENQREELKAWRKKNRWSPLQIRHTAATLIRKQYGLEAAQAVLGHARIDTTQIYAEKLAELAKEIAKAMG
jgi:integrase